MRATPPTGSTSLGLAEESYGPCSRASLAMAAAEKPLEFHAKRPWGPENGLEDPDEDEEDDNDETEDAFSLQEVLRLGGTKVMVSGFRRKETGAWRGREWNCPASGGSSGQAAPELRSGRASRTQTPASKCTLRVSCTSFP